MTESGAGPPENTPSRDVSGDDGPRRQAARRSTLLVAAGTFLFWVSLYLYVPVLPLQAKDLGAGPALIGAVVASYAIGQLILRIPIGVGSDVFGRKPFAFASAVLAALGALWLGLASDPWSLFAARTLTGVAAAGWVAISVLYSSYFATGRTATAMALIMSINASAVMMSTLVGGVIADAWGAEVSFFAAAGAGALSAGALILAREPSIARTPFSMPTLTRILKTPLLIQVALIAITFQFVTFAVNFGFLPVLAQDLGASKAQVGYITTTGLVVATAGTAASALVVSRLSTSGALLAASVTLLIPLLLLPFVESLLIIAVLVGVGGLGRGVANTVCIGLTIRSASQEERATAMGAYQAIYAIGMLAGPAVAGWLVGAYGIDSVFWLSAGVTAVGGVLVISRRLPAP